MRNNRFVWLLTLLSATLLPAEVPDTLVSFQERPHHFQLVTRDAADSAQVPFTGQVLQTGYDSILVSVLKDGSAWRRIGSELVYTGEEAPFSLVPKIHAELSEYTFVLELVAGTAHQHLLTVDSVACGDAFILTGQSNSHYVWSQADFRSEYCRTFGVKTGNSNYYPYVPGDTLWDRSQAVAWEGPNVGVLGLYIQKFILEEYQIPTGLINGGTGGSEISEHLPSGTDRMDLNTIYGKTLYRVRKGNISDIRGIIWHQGENDSEPAKTTAYPARFQELYQAWQTDFDPEKVYVFQLRPGGAGSSQGRFREMQRTLPDSLAAPDIKIMATCGLPGWDGRFAPGELEERLSCFADHEHAAISGAGHMLHYDRPEALTAAITDFLERRL